MKLKSLYLLGAVLLSGCCMHIRESETCLEPGYISEDKIVTKHKYRLAKAIDSVDADLENLNVILQSCQPGVFALDGIPVVVSSQDIKCANLAGTFSGKFIYSLITLSVIPAHSTSATFSREYKLRLAEGECDGFITQTMRESAQSYFPTSYLLSWIVWNDDRGCEWERDYTADFAMIASSKNVPAKKSFAYGLACRIKEVEDSGADVTQIFNVKEIPRYSIDAWRQNGANLEFKLSLMDVILKPDAEMLQLVKENVAEKMIEAYIAEHPSLDARNLRVAFKAYSCKNKRIFGSAEIIAMRLELESSYYDSYSRTGKVAFRVRKAQYEMARNWARQHISEIARDKNIRLVGDKIPASAAFYLGNEKYENGILEMEYIVE